VAVNAVKAIGNLMSKFPVHEAECCRILTSIINSTTDENMFAVTLTVLHANLRICVHHKQVTICQIIFSYSICYCDSV